MGLTSDIAQTILEQGRIQGEGAARAGQIWGTTIANLGQIPNQIRQQQQQDQEHQFRQQELGLRTQSLGLQVQQQQAQAATQQRQQAAEDALNGAYAKALQPDGSINMSLLAQGVANTPAASTWPKIQEQLTAAQEKGAQVAKIRGEVDTAEREHMAALANAADTAPDPASKAGILLTGFAAGAKDGSIAPDHARDAISGFLGPDGQPDPQAVSATIARMKQLSAPDIEKRSQAANAAVERQNRAAQLPGIQAESTIKQQVADNMQGGLTADQRADNARQAEAVTRSEAAQQEQARHNKVDERLAGARIAKEGAGLSPVEIKPNSREYRLAQDLAYGTLTMADFNRIYGRAASNANLKVALYDKARELNPNFNPAQFELGFKMASNPQIRQRLVAIDSLDPVIDKIEGLAKQADFTSLPAVNKLLAGAKFQLGDKTVTNYRQLQTLLGDEVGNALGVGTGSDLKTKLGLDLVNPNLGPQQFISTMEQLKTVLQARRAALAPTMGPYAGVGGATAPAPDATAPNKIGRFEIVGMK